VTKYRLQAQTILLKGYFLILPTNTMTAPMTGLVSYSCTFVGFFFLAETGAGLLACSIMS
jgi:hypothetical protein